MCGIAGYFSLDKNTDRAQMLGVADAMQKTIAHRGPDGHGVWQDPELPLILAHRRLAIIDLSKDGHQPMQSQSGRFVISFNGEVYNYLEIKKKLQEAGLDFKTKTDTEVLLTAFETWGFEKALSKVNGMFAFALWDKETQQLCFARDRFGKKPLYIGWAGQNLVFASELKAFHAHPAFKKEVNRSSLALYMQYGYVCAPHSIFSNVWQFLPGSCLTLEVQTLRSGTNLSDYFQKYWDLPSIVRDRGIGSFALRDAYEQFETLLEKAVSQRMISDVPLGAFLSGGIDSSAIVALMQKNAPAPIKTFSIGFQEAHYNEAEKAKAIAAHLGTQHEEFYVSAQDAMNVVPSIAAMYDEPFADSSQIPTHLISKLARQKVTVALTGDGGDEILGGYERHTHIPALWSKMSWAPQFIRQPIGIAAQFILQYLYDKLNSKTPHFGRKMHRALKLMTLKDQQEIYEHLLAAWPNPEQVVTGSTLPDIPLKQRVGWSKNLSFAEEMMMSDCISYRSDDVMVKADRASMAVGLELRAPLMDYELAEFCWELPLNMKIKGTTGKLLLRHLLKQYVPQNLTHGPKQHFGLPLDEWLNGPLKGWANDMLSVEQLKKQNYLDAELVSKAWQVYQSGKRDKVSAKAIWTALMFQSWSQRWL